MAEEIVQMEDVRSCKYCNQPVVWLESHKTHKKYPVDAHTSNGDPRQEIPVKRNEFHKCMERDQAMRKY